MKNNTEKITCNCSECENNKTCIHCNAFRRLPRSQGGLGLCPKLESRN